MADRVYPASKPTPASTGTGTGPPPSFPATKAQMYGAARPAYRPQPPPKRRRRSCCCACCLWITLILLALILLGAIAGGVFYVLYRPHRPTFTVSSLRLTSFNITASGKLTSKLDISVTARNPNQKVVFIYDAADVSVYSDDVGVGTGSFPGFVHETKNTTVMKTTVTAAGVSLDSIAAGNLKRKKDNLPLEIEFETKVGLKVGGVKTKKVKMQAKCVGFSAAVPKAGKAAASSTAPDVRCKVKLRFKIWKWTV